jgi:hypothetical protein
LDAPVGGIVGADCRGAIQQMKGQQPHGLLAGGPHALVHGSREQHPDHAGHLPGIGDRPELGGPVSAAVDADPADLALEVEQIPTDARRGLVSASKTTSRPSWRATSRKLGR